MRADGRDRLGITGGAEVREGTDVIFYAAGALFRNRRAVFGGSREKQNIYRANIRIWVYSGINKKNIKDF